MLGCEVSFILSLPLQAVDNCTPAALGLVFQNSENAQQMVILFLPV